MDKAESRAREIAKQINPVCSCPIVYTDTEYCEDCESRRKMVPIITEALKQHAEEAVKEFASTQRKCIPHTWDSQGLWCRYCGTQNPQESIDALRGERDKLKHDCSSLKAQLEEAKKDTKYQDCFGKAMNDYHQAYLKEKHKVDDLEQRLAEWVLSHKKASDKIQDLERQLKDATTMSQSRLKEAEEAIKKIADDYTHSGLIAKQFLNRKEGGK